MYGTDPYMILGDLAESELFLKVLLDCEEFLAKEAKRKAKR